MRSKKLFALSSFALSLLAVACNDSDAGGGGSSLAMCSAFQPCGGELQGKWKVVSLCFDDPQSLLGASVDEPECENLFRGMELHASGSYDFTADSVSSDVRFTMDLDVLWTTECLTAVANGGAIDLPRTCSGIEANYASNPQFAGASCMVEGTACSCMVTTVERRSTSDTGPYSISGSSLVDDEGKSGYCVDGNTLRIHSSGADGGAMVTLARE